MTGAASTQDTDGSVPAPRAAPVPRVPVTGSTDRVRAALHRASLLRQQSALLRRQAVGLRDGGRPFTVVGWADGRRTSVRWQHGRLRADEHLHVRLRLVEELGRAEGDLPAPSLRGDRTQRLLAVLRAFDRIEQVDLEVGRPRPGAERR